MVHVFFEQMFVFANVPQTSAYTQAPFYTMAQTDRKALVALYNATGGAKWRNKRNWNTSAALSQWYGVEVNSQGRVVELSLGRNNLQGIILRFFLAISLTFPKNSLTDSQWPFHEVASLTTCHNVVSFVRSRVLHTVYA